MSSSRRGPRISPLSRRYGRPRTTPTDRCSMTPSQQDGRSPSMLFHASEVTRDACFEHSNFLKVTSPRKLPEQQSSGEPARQRGCTGQYRRSALDHSGTPCLRLRAFQPQQISYTLLELELPQMLAPDLPSSCSSMGVLHLSHSNRPTLRARRCYVSSLPHPLGIG